MKFSIYQASRQGGRKYNQDRVAYSYSKDALLMVVADGMGGHLHGEVAAQLTVQLLTEKFQKQAKPALRNPFSFLYDSLMAVHHAIDEYAAEHELLETPRTTCVCCVIQNDTVYWAHVGDSRLYLFRRGELIGRTQDHSRVRQLFDQGKISEAEMSTHPERNKIYNCLGGMIPPDIELSKQVALEDGDTLLLSTDGLWSMLTINEVASILSAYPINLAIPELLDHAEFRGGEDGDNLSAIGMTWGGGAMGDHLESISTAAMQLDAFTTQMDTFESAREGASVTEEEIERAIAEIQLAIKKYSR